MNHVEGVVVRRLSMMRIMARRMSSITVDTITRKELAGESIARKEINASGNGAAIGGIRLSTDKGWIAARPCGTEDIYKIY